MTRAPARLFEKVTGVVGRDDAADVWSPPMTPVTIVFTGDGRELGAFTVTRDSRPEDISAEVRGITDLRIEIAAPQSGMGNVALIFGSAMIQ